MSPNVHATACRESLEFARETLASQWAPSDPDKMLDLLDALDGAAAELAIFEAQYDAATAVSR